MTNLQSKIFTSDSIMLEQNLSAIIELEKRALKYSWSGDSWRSFLTRPSHSSDYLLITLEEDELCGFILFSLDSFDGHHELLKIVVIPERHGDGIAQQLFKTSIAEIKTHYKFADIYLDVALSNKRAISFYKTLGFVEVRKMKKFYSDGADAIGMLLSA